MLDGHQEIPSGFPGDGFRGFPLGVRGVEGDQGRFSSRDSRGVQEGARLGDLVGAIGYPDLRYRDSLAVKHRGGQRDLVVLVSPGAAHCLSVERDSHSAFPRFRARAKSHAPVTRSSSATSTLVSTFRMVDSLGYLQRSLNQLHSAPSFLSSGWGMSAAWPAISR